MFDFFSVIKELFFLISSPFSLFQPTHTLVTPHIPDFPCTMTPMSSRRTWIYLALAIIGLCCSLSTGHVHGLTIPLDLRSFPAIAHAPHSYPHSSPYPTVSHRSFEKAVIKLASTPEDDPLQELFSLAFQGNEQGSLRPTLLPLEDSNTKTFFIFTSQKMKPLRNLDIHTRLVLRKRTDDDEEGNEKKGSNHDGHNKDDHNDEHYDDNENDNDRKGREDDKEEYHYGNETNRQNENHDRDADESDHDQDAEEAERARREQEDRERLEREAREKEEEAEREANERETEKENEEVPHGEIDDEQSGTVAFCI